MTCTYMYVMSLGNLEISSKWWRLSISWQLTTFSTANGCCCCRCCCCLFSFVFHFSCCSCSYLFANFFLLFVFLLVALVVSFGGTLLSLRSQPGLDVIRMMDSEDDRTCRKIHVITLLKMSNDVHVYTNSRPNILPCLVVADKLAC